MYDSVGSVPSTILVFCLFVLDLLGMVIVAPTTIPAFGGRGRGSECKVILSSMIGSKPACEILGTLSPKRRKIKKLNLKRDASLNHTIIQNVL